MSHVRARRELEAQRACDGVARSEVLERFLAVVNARRRRPREIAAQRGEPLVADALGERAVRDEF